MVATQQTARAVRIFGSAKLGKRRRLLPNACATLNGYRQNLSLHFTHLFRDLLGALDLQRIDRVGEGRVNLLQA
jgi:hypothetical protein